MFIDTPTTPAMSTYHSTAATAELSPKIPQNPGAERPQELVQPRLSECRPLSTKQTRNFHLGSPQKHKLQNPLTKGPPKLGPKGLGGFRLISQGLRFVVSTRTVTRQARIPAKSASTIELTTRRESDNTKEQHVQACKNLSYKLTPRFEK